MSSDDDEPDWLIEQTSARKERLAAQVLDSSDDGEHVSLFRVQLMPAAAYTPPLSGAPSSARNEHPSLPSRLPRVQAK